MVPMRLPSPLRIWRWESMVATTGSGESQAPSQWEEAALRPRRSCERPPMTMHCSPSTVRGRDAVLPGPAQSTDFALDPTYTETPGNDPRQRLRGARWAPSGVSQTSESHQRMSTRAWLAKPP